MPRKRTAKQNDGEKRSVANKSLSTQMILRNLAIIIPCYYIIFYSVASIVHAIFGLKVFDPNSPFNFKACCLKSSQEQASAISLIATCFLSTFLFLFVTTQRFWDHMITLTIFHILLTALVMLEFPTNWQWWIALVIGLSVMLIVGELISFCIRRKKRRKTVVSSNLST